MSDCTRTRISSVYPKEFVAKVIPRLLDAPTPGLECLDMADWCDSHSAVLDFYVDAIAKVYTSPACKCRLETLQWSGGPLTTSPAHFFRNIRRLDLRNTRTGWDILFVGRMLPHIESVSVVFEQRSPHSDESVVAVRAITSWLASRCAARLPSLQCLKLGVSCEHYDEWLTEPLLTPDTVDLSECWHPFRCGSHLSGRLAKAESLRILRPKQSQSQDTETHAMLHEALGSRPEHRPLTLDGFWLMDRVYLHSLWFQSQLGRLSADVRLALSTVATLDRARGLADAIACLSRKQVLSLYFVASSSSSSTSGFADSDSYDSWEWLFSQLASDRVQLDVLSVDFQQTVMSERVMSALASFCRQSVGIRSLVMCSFTPLVGVDDVVRATLRPGNAVQSLVVSGIGMDVDWGTCLEPLLCSEFEDPSAPPDTPEGAVHHCLETVEIHRVTGLYARVGRCAKSLSRILDRCPSLHTCRLDFSSEEDLWLVNIRIPTDATDCREEIVWDAVQSYRNRLGDDDRDDSDDQDNFECESTPKRLMSESQQAVLLGNYEVSCA